MTDKMPQSVQNLMGMEVCYGAKEYGTIISAEAVVTNRQVEWEVITDAGYSFSANQLINLVSEIMLSSSSYEEDNGRYQKLGYVAPNSQSSKFSWGNAKPYASAIISNVANVNGEYINISKRPNS